MGKVNNIKSAGGRNGRTLSFGCNGLPTKGKAKQLTSKHFDDKTAGDIMKLAAEAAGIAQVFIDPTIAAVKFAYFAQVDESFVHFGQRIAGLLGGTFKVMGDRAVMVKRNGGISASGKPLKTIRGVFGDNLTTWDIAPSVGRPRHKQVTTKHYDAKKAKWEYVNFATGDTQATAAALPRHAQGSKDHAEHKAKSGATEADRSKGGGTVSINGEPDAQPEAKFELSGARPGIDGTYLIDGVNHSLNRSGGFMTSLTLRMPQGTTDKR